MKAMINIFASFYRDKEVRHYIRDFYKNLYRYRKILQTHRNYNKVITELKETKTKINVIFLVNEISKWKTKSLFDLMARSSEFSPLIALTMADYDTLKETSKEQRKEKLESLQKYFDTRNIPYVVAYDMDKDEDIDLVIFNPRIVFYQQPWGICPRQRPSYVSKFAITCYVPYYVENYCILSQEYMDFFHPYLYKYYLLNNDYAYMFKQIFPGFRGEFNGAGHTGLDQLNKFNADGVVSSSLGRKTIIYAPHWSFKHPLNSNLENYSTFPEFGQFILNFAKNHSDVKWIFKPHPTLKYTVLKTGIMTTDEVDNYYKAWNNIGISSIDNEYPKLFNESDLLITDCGSFLTEYFSTGKPIIHLQSEFGTKPFPYMRPMYEAFYRVRTYDEFETAFKNIVYEDKDVKKTQRQELLKFYGLDDNSAAVRIVDDLKKLLPADLLVDL